MGLISNILDDTLADANSIWYRRKNSVDLNVMGMNSLCAIQRQYEYYNNKGYIKKSFDTKTPLWEIIKEKHQEATGKHD